MSDDASTPPRRAARLTSLNQLSSGDVVADDQLLPVTRLAARLLGLTGAGLLSYRSPPPFVKAVTDPRVAAWAGDPGFVMLGQGSRLPIMIPDLREDPRFACRPMVRADDGPRFLIGAPLIDHAGDLRGTLFGMDAAPRAGMKAADLAALTDLAQIAMTQIDRQRLTRIGDIATQLADTMPDALVCTDRAGCIQFWNGAAERLFGYPAQVAVGRSIALIVPPNERAAYDRAVAETPHAPNDGRTHELSARHADGRALSVELSLAAWQTGGMPGVVAVIRDISVRKRLEQEHLQARTFLDAIVEHLPAMLTVKDARTRRYLLINRAGCELIGIPREKLIGYTDREICETGGADRELQDDIALASDGGLPPVEIPYVNHHGEAYDIRTRLIVVDGPDAERQYIVGLTENVTDVRRAQAEVQRLEHFDPLTGLPNRRSYLERLNLLIAAGTPLALLVIGLNRFKTVNDQFGHMAGDVVLTEAGARLSALVDADDVVARVGGDEFVVLVVGRDAHVRAARVADEAAAAMARPFGTVRGTAHVGAGVGAAIFPGDATTAAELVRCGDAALYRAKTEQRDVSICFYERQIDDDARDRLVLEQDLRAAMARDEISLAYQPVFHATTARITSVEALARWDHPRRGEISPAVFISIAEQYGLIVELGAMLLRRACNDALLWPGEIAVAVNLSPLQFEHGDLVQTVRDTLEETGLPPHRLQLEVTEGLVLNDVEDVFRKLERLRALGIKILMDDFGTGYSSLGYFQRFPFDKVKIDQSFVGGLGNNRAAEAIVRAVAGLGKALDMPVIAEGVETEEQMTTLIAAGCSHVQGYLFSRPMPPSELRAVLHSQHPPAG